MAAGETGHAAATSTASVPCTHPHHVLSTRYVVVSADFCWCYARVRALNLCCTALYGTQVHTVHGSGAEPSHQEGPSSTSSSSSRAMPWRQLHQGLTQGSHQAAWLGESASGSSSSTSRRPYITSFSPLQQPALADSPSAAESAADAALEAADNEQRGMQLNPAAAPKQIEGVCRRRNIKCGWKKIDFVLRMVSVSGPDSQGHGVIASVDDSTSR